MEEGLHACGGLECKHRKGVLYICEVLYREGGRRPLNTGRGEGVEGGVKVQGVGQHSLTSAGRGQGVDQTLDAYWEVSRGVQHLWVAHQYAADTALLVEVADAVAAGAGTVLEGAGRGTVE